MFDYGLSTQQLAVICALSSGATMTAAAEEAGVHRNTITNWLRNLFPFQQALAGAPSPSSNRLHPASDPQVAHPEIPQNLHKDAQSGLDIRVKSCSFVASSPRNLHNFAQGCTTKVGRNDTCPCG